jgi:hypothetical protein
MFSRDIEQTAVIKKFFAAVGLFVVGIPFIMLMSIIGLMWRAWWLYPVWAWFLVPLGLPAISFWHFAALLLLISLLTVHDNIKKDDREVSWIAVAVSFMFPMIAWVTMRWLR